MSRKKIILISGENCHPCKLLKQAIMPIITGINIEYIELDRDKDIDEVKQYNVQSVPTLLIFENDALIIRKDGYSPQPKWLANLCDAIKGV